MAKISIYPHPTTPQLGDYLLGTDISDMLATKNYLISDILSLSTLDMVLNNGNSSLLTANVGQIGLWNADISNGSGGYGSYGYIALSSPDGAASKVTINGGGFDTPVLLESSDEGYVHFKYGHFNPTFLFDGITADRYWIWQDRNGNVAFLEDVLGKIILRDPSGAFFNSLASARAYIASFCSYSPSFDCYRNGEYKFNIDSGASFTLADGFCSNVNMSFEDPTGLIVAFGNNCFVNNTKNNIFGNIAVGNAFLKGAVGNNTIGNISAGIDLLSGASPTVKNTIYKIVSCGATFAYNYTGRMDVTLWGTSGAQNLPNDIFTSSNLCWIHTAWSNKYNNTGFTQDGDVTRVQANFNGSTRATLIFD